MRGLKSKSAGPPAEAAARHPDSGSSTRMPTDVAGATSSSTSRSDAPYVYITVGTTSFDPFVEAACSTDFAVAVVSRGYSRVLMQVGRGRFSVPANAKLLPASSTDNTIGSSSAASTDDTWSFELPVVDTASPGHDAAASRHSARKSAATTSTAAPGAGGWLRFDVYRFKPSIREDMQGASLIISHAGAGSIFESLRLNKPLVVVVNTALADNHQVELAEAMARPRGRPGDPASSSPSSAATTTTARSWRSTQVAEADSSGATGPHLTWCEPHDLVLTLRSLDVSVLRPLPRLDTTRFTASVDRLMGFG